MTGRLRCYEFPRNGCVNRADIYYPRNKGGWPTVVTIHGGLFRALTFGRHALYADPLVKEDLGIMIY